MEDTLAEHHLERQDWEMWLMRLDLKAHGIKTAAGRRIYDTARRQIDSLHKRLMDPKISRAEEDRIHRKISEIETRAIKEAKSSKPVKKKQISLRRLR
jgi:hypothetical protein